MAINEPGTGSSTNYRSAGALVLDFSTGRTENVCCLSHTVHGLYLSLNRLRQYKLHILFNVIYYIYYSNMYLCISISIFISPHFYFLIPRPMFSDYGGENITIMLWTWAFVLDPTLNQLLGAHSYIFRNSASQLLT